MGILSFVSLEWKCEVNKMSKNNASHNRRSERGQGFGHQSMLENASEYYFSSEKYDSPWEMYTGLSEKLIFLLY